MEERLTKLAERTGRTKTFYAREAIEQHLEDLEDYYRAWHANLPIDWETFKRDGIWMDRDRPLELLGVLADA